MIITFKAATSVTFVTVIFSLFRFLFLFFFLQIITLSFPNFVDETAANILECLQEVLATAEHSTTIKTV